MNKEIKSVDDVKTLSDFIDFINADMILCNNITKVDECLFDDQNLEPSMYWDINVKKTPKRPIDIYQYFIISDDTAENFKRWTDYPIFYSNVLDCYVLGITHYGTSWDNINIEIINK